VNAEFPSNQRGLTFVCVSISNKNVMKYPALFCLVLGLALTTSFVACDKDDDDDEQTVFQKSGLILNGAQETPPVTTSASGTMDVSYDKTTKMLTLAVTWGGLSDNAVAAHIHGTAPKGVFAFPKVDYSGQVTTSAGTLNTQVAVDEVAIKEDSLLAGFYYFNIHTPANPGGEIRGQIEF
jgi:hypothetical protein